MEAIHEAQVVPLHHQNGVERINGIKMHLGSMSVGVLQQLEEYTRQRIDEAHNDLWLIQSYIEGAPSGPAAA
jgi:hypothetical protein